MLTNLSPQRMEEILQVNRKKEWEKEITGQRIGVKDFSAGPHQWHGGLGSTDLDIQAPGATVEVICLNHRGDSEEHQRSPGRAPWPLLCWPSSGKSTDPDPFLC